MKKEIYYYIFARFISSMGSWFQALAFPFLIYKVTGSAFGVSISFILNTIPALLLATICGKLIDTYSRKNIIIFFDFFRFLVLFFWTCFGLNNIILIYIVSIILTTSNMFYNTAINPFIPDILKNTLTTSLKKVNSIESLVLNISMIISPILAGTIIYSYSYSLAFFINSGSFLLSALLLLYLPRDKRKVNGISHSIKELLKEPFNLRESLELINKSKILKLIISIGVMFSVCGGIFMSLDAIYIKEVFSNSEVVFGYINTAWGIGMLISTIILSTIIFFFRDISFVKIYFFSMIGMGIATLGYGLSSVILFSIFFNFIGGLSNSIYMVGFKTILQENTSSKSRGKVFSTQSAISKSISAIVLAITGILADTFGVGPVISFSGILAILIATLGYIRYLNLNPLHLLKNKEKELNS